MQPSFCDKLLCVMRTLCVWFFLCKRAVRVVPLHLKSTMALVSILVKERKGCRYSTWYCITYLPVWLCNDELSFHFMYLYLNFFFCFVLCESDVDVLQKMIIACLFMMYTVLLLTNRAMRVACVNAEQPSVSQLLAIDLNSLWTPTDGNILYTLLSFLLFQSYASVWMAVCICTTEYHYMAIWS